MRARCARSPSARLVQVQTAQDALLAALGHRRHRVVLVVQRDVVEDVLAVDVHAPHAVTDHGRELVRECRIVDTHVRDRAEEQWRMSILVLQPLAVQRGASRGAAEHEAASARIAERPDEVADALVSEHRVVDVERDDRLAVGRVRGARGGEAAHRARLGDALLEDLPVDRLAIGQHHPRVDRLVALPERRVDLHLAEERVHAEGARLIRDDRDDPVADRSGHAAGCAAGRRTPSSSTPRAFRCR